MKLLEKLEKQWKKNSGSLLFAQLADLLLQENELDRAQEVVSSGLEKHPQFLPGLLVQGKIYQQSGQATEAIEFFKKAVNMDGRCLAALKSLSVLLAESEPEPALQYSEKYTLLNPYGPPIGVVAEFIPTEELLAEEEVNGFDEEDKLEQAESAETLDSENVSQALDDIFSSGTEAEANQILRSNEENTEHPYDDSFEIPASGSNLDDSVAVSSQDDLDAIMDSFGDLTKVTATTKTLPSKMKA